MPAAEAFHATAKRNGFPFCLEKINVADDGTGSPYDWWSTLGGITDTNVGSQTPEQKKEKIALSFENAYNLYWRTYALNYSLSSSGSGDNSGSIDVENDNANQLAVPPGVVPRDRLCENEFESVTFSTSDGYGVAFGYPSTDFYVGFRSTPSANPIVKMYDGATSNESNFVGYGVKSNFTDFFSAAAFPEPPVAGLIAPVYDDISGLSSYIVCQSYLNEISPAPTLSDYNYTNVPISGSADTIPMVCGIPYWDIAPLTLSAANRSATDGGTPNPNSSSIDSIEFYAPPT